MLLIKRIGRGLAAARNLPTRWHSGAGEASSAELVTVKWKNRNGEVVETKAKVGQSLLICAHNNGIELEGACEGVCACSTCHVILEEHIYEDLPEPSEEEEDMLDQAFGLTNTSRLGCQICLTKKLDGMLATIPKATRNFYVDGHVPKPH